LALLIVLALVICYRRRSRRLYLSQLDTLHNIEANARASNPLFVEKDDWLLRVDGAMAEAAKETERAQLWTNSNPKHPDSSDLDHHSTDGYWSPDAADAQVQREPGHAAFQAPTMAYVEDEWENHDHLYTSRSTSYSGSLGEEIDPAPATVSWGQPDSTSDRSERQGANGSTLEVDKMDAEAVRERRQAEILEQMRKVLEGQR